jgi:hypothetical protein
MNKYRINTTISKKHWDLLKKYAHTYETQQKVLEQALENLDARQNEKPPLSPEQDLVVRFLEAKAGCLIEKDGLKMLLDNCDPDNFHGYIDYYKPMEYAIEYYYQKPLKECQLEEVIEGIAMNARMLHWFDTVVYTDDGDHYMLKITHPLGVNATNLFRTMIESVFATYGVPTVSTISGKTFFLKIFKDEGIPQSRVSRTDLMTTSGISQMCMKDCNRSSLDCTQ